MSKKKKWKNKGLNGSKNLIPFVELSSYRKLKVLRFFTRVYRENSRTKLEEILRDNSNVTGFDLMQKAIEEQNKFIEEFFYRICRRTKTHLYAHQSHTIPSN